MKPRVGEEWQWRPYGARDDGEGVDRGVGLGGSDDGKEARERGMLPLFDSIGRG